MPPGESIAIFDQDGTLRVKHPVILRLLPRGHDQRWSLDCVSDVLADGGHPGLVAARELGTLVAARRKPAMIVSDTGTGTGLTSHASLRWQEEPSVGWHYIASDKPVQKSFVESLNAAPGRMLQ